jgi:hypothetical protein
MQSCAEEDEVIVYDHQGLISSSNSEKQYRLLMEKVLPSLGWMYRWSSFTEMSPS